LGGVHELSTGSRKEEAAKPSDHAASGGEHDPSKANAKVQATSQANMQALAA